LVKRKTYAFVTAVFFVGPPVESAGVTEITLLAGCQQGRTIPSSRRQQYYEQTGGKPAALKLRWHVRSFLECCG
jgi:hypothetical protein